eukprot:c1011_g1_i1.p1 GENE.c1011_g1_i1~~c1011_g1_i1.p1  ORF type:complete len:242 (+),score=45.98 c1011_g1_i1:41-727(+)
MVDETSISAFEGILTAMDSDASSDTNQELASKRFMKTVLALCSRSACSAISRSKEELTEDQFNNLVKSLKKSTALGLAAFEAQFQLTPDMERRWSEQEFSKAYDALLELRTKNRNIALAVRNRKFWIDVATKFNNCTPLDLQVLFCRICTTIYKKGELTEAEKLELLHGPAFTCPFTVALEKGRAKVRATGARKKQVAATTHSGSGNERGAASDTAPPTSPGSGADDD